jgi:hypothetical protein
VNRPLTARLSAPLRRLSAVGTRLQNEPVVVPQLVGFGIDILVGVGAPVTPDLKLGAVGLVTTIATLFGRSQSVPVNTLVSGAVTQSAPGQPVTITAPSGAVQTIGGTVS